MTAVAPADTRSATTRRMPARVFRESSNRCTHAARARESWGAGGAGASSVGSATGSGGRARTLGSGPVAVLRSEGSLPGPQPAASTSADARNTRTNERLRRATAPGCWGWDGSYPTLRRPPSTVDSWVAEPEVHGGAPQQPPRGPEVR